MTDDILTSRHAGDIYRLIYTSGSCSRQQISDSLGLSLPTVTNSLKNLMEENLIYNAGSFDSTGGRKAMMFRCVPTARYAAGLDITKNHLSVVVINLNGEILASRRLRAVFEDTDDYYQLAMRHLNTLITDHDIPEDNLLGLGISLPVIVGDDSRSISYATVINVSADIYQRMAKWIPYPFLFFNDANSGGLAESWTSSSAENEVYLSLSSSVGGAAINHRQIMDGSNHRASEFGHMKIVPNGRPCYCGQKGCLNAYCSAKTLASFTDGDLKKFFSELPSNIGFQNYFDEYLDYLAIAVNNLRMCYDCDVILGGNVGAYMNSFIDLLRQKATLLNPYEQNSDYIRVCHYQTEAAAAGAALYYVSKFIQEM